MQEAETQGKIIVKNINFLRNMHEVSRRMLSTLLRKIDSFESNNDVMLICATNRKQDLDEAVLSRVDLM